jgi:small subunit ribosomal protein S6
MVIVSPQVADDDVPEMIEQLVRRPVETGGGQIEEVNQWGRRRLAYPIRSHAEGNYVLTNIRIDPGQTKDLERGLQISEDVIRHLLVRLDEEAPA